MTAIYAIPICIAKVTIQTITATNKLFHYLLEDRIFIGHSLFAVNSKGCGFVSVTGFLKAECQIE